MPTRKEPQPPEVSALLKTAQAFGVNAKEVGKVIDVIVDVAGKEMPGEQKAETVKQQVIEDKGGHSWPETAYKWASLIVKVAFTIAKITGRVK
jgi:hypothetical protein